MKLQRIFLAANDVAQAMLANAADGGSPFAILQSDGFLIPYGEFPHKQGLQVFDRAAAEAMVANHNGVINKVVSWARGKETSYPVYIGHPDLPGSKDTDKRAYGWIEGMIAENDGLRLTVKWSDAGRELVENAHFKFYSPLWWTKPLKRGVIRPVALKSMGLTNDPNIPVPALANEADDDDTEQEESQTTDTMKEIYLALGLDETATPEQALAKITELKTASDEAAKYAAMKSEKEKADADKMAAENARDTAETEATALRASLTAAANAAVDAAVSAGQITAAERDTKATALLAANDFAKALQELGKLLPSVKTRSVTGNLGGAKSLMVAAANHAGAADRTERATLVENEFQATNPELSLGERKRIAWQRAQAKHPALFGKKGSSDGAA